MQNTTAQHILDFVEVARKINANVWLMTPSGIIFGQPATIKQYMAAMFKHTSENQTESRDNSLAQIDEDDKPYAILLVDARLNSGAQAFNLGPAIIDATQVSGWGVFTEIR